jgi:hypothetical protein
MLDEADSEKSKDSSDKGHSRSRSASNNSGSFSGLLKAADKSFNKSLSSIDQRIRGKSRRSSSSNGDNTSDASNDSQETGIVDSASPSPNRSPTPVNMLARKSETPPTSPPLSPSPPPTSDISGDTADAKVPPKPPPRTSSRPSRTNQLSPSSSNSGLNFTITSKNSDATSPPEGKEQRTPPKEIVSAKTVESVGSTSSTPTAVRHSSSRHRSSAQEDNVSPGSKSSNNHSSQSSRSSKVATTESKPSEGSPEKEKENSRGQSVADGFDPSVMPLYMEPVAKPSDLENIPMLTKERFTDVECETMVNHVRWQLKIVLKCGQIMRDYRTLMEPGYAGIVLRRAIAAAKEVKVVATTLSSIDTKLASQEQRQTAVYETAVKLAEVTVTFISVCQKISKGLDFEDLFEECFSSFVSAGMEVNNALKFLHFHSAKEFSLRPFLSYSSFM